MRAAILANVHVSNVYRLRHKLDAFQEDGIWFIPRDALNKYIDGRARRAREILSTSVAFDKMTASSESQRAPDVLPGSGPVSEEIR
jgi:hypothetical protein